MTFNLLNKTISISFIFFFKKTTCIKVVILVRVYLTGLPIQLTYTGKPKRVCAQLCKYVFYLTNVTIQVNLSIIPCRVWLALIVNPSRGELYKHI